MYSPGQTVTDQTSFKNADGDLYNPTTVVLEVRHPDGSLSYPTTTFISTGVWRANFIAYRGFTRWIWDGITGAVHDKLEGCVCAAESVTAA